MAAANDDISGIWQCRYWYLNTKHAAREDVNEYLVRIERVGREYVLHNLPNKGELAGSHLAARLVMDNSVVTGSWQEDTAPSGEWMGMTYKGALQLLLDDDRARMEGRWVAAGYNNGVPKIFTGRWELVRAAETVQAAA